MDIKEQRAASERNLQGVPARRKGERINAIHELAAAIELQARIWRDRTAAPAPTSKGIDSLAASCDALAAGIRALQ